MTLKLTLETSSNNVLLPINYQYPLSAAIYKIIRQGDKTYATFLHDIGYKQPESLKTFKFFCFSDIRIPFKIQGDHLRLLNRRAELRVSFHLPEAAESFIKGLFCDQRVEVADRKSKVIFILSGSAAGVFAA